MKRAWFQKLGCCPGCGKWFFGPRTQKRCAECAAKHKSVTRERSRRRLRVQRRSA